MFRAIIIDDEQTAVDNLEWELEHFTDEIKVIDTFTSPDEAIHGINYLKPDCVFLDIEMPGKDGFTLLNKLEYRNFHLIITTAYENYALKAFEENAIDYLLKPIDIDDLKKTVARLKERTGIPDFSEKIKKIVDDIINKHNHLDKIAIPVGGKILLIPIQDIIFCKSKGNYTEIFPSERKKILLSKTLKQLAQILEHPNIIRVHQSYLVNIGHVREYNRGDGGFWY